MRGKKSVLQEALTGRFRDHHGYLLRMMTGRIDAITAQAEELTRRIDEVLAPFARQVAQLDEIPGAGKTGAQELIAEIGTDMIRFPTSGHLVSWARFAPRARQSAGKAKPGTTGKGSPWIAGAPGEAVMGAARTKTFLGSRYHRLARKRGKQRAIVATGRSILVIACQLLSDPGAQLRRPRPGLARPHRPAPPQTPAHRRTRTAIRQEGHPPAGRRLTSARLHPGSADAPPGRCRLPTDRPIFDSAARSRWHLPGPSGRPLPKTWDAGA
jgi:hypothetical protein